jgi:hypothetical protein
MFFKQLKADLQVMRLCGLSGAFRIQGSISICMYLAYKAPNEVAKHQILDCESVPSAFRTKQQLLAVYVINFTLSIQNKSRKIHNHKDYI